MSRSPRDDQAQYAGRRLRTVGSRHPKSTLAVAAMVVALLATQLTTLPTRPIFEGDLPADDPIVRQANAFSRNHPNRNFYVIAIENTDADGIWQRSTLEKIIAISEEAKLLEGAMPNVQSLATWNDVRSDEDSVRIAPLLTRSDLGGSTIDSIRRRAQADPLIVNRLVSASGQVALIRITFRDDADPIVLHREMSNIRTRYQQPERIHLFGREFLNAEIDFAMTRHLSVFLPIAVMLLLSFAYICFGRVQAVVAMLIVVAATQISYLGLLGLFSVPQTIASSTIPVLLLVTVGSSVLHLLQRAYAEAGSCPWRSAVHVAAEDTGLAVIVASATTAVGMLSLTVFEIFSVREFGLLAAGGTVLGAAFALTLTPALLAIAPPSPRSGESRIARLFAYWVARVTARIGIVATRSPCATALGAIAVIVVAAAGIASLQVGSQPPHYFREGHDVREAYQRIATNFGGAGFIFLELESPHDRDIRDPELLREVTAVQQRLTAHPHIAYASSLADRVAARLHRVMNGDRPEFDRVPESAELLTEYIELFRWNAPHVLSEMLEDVDAPHRMVVDIFTEVDDSAVIATTVGDIERTLASSTLNSTGTTWTLGGEWVEWIAQNRYIVRGKLLSLATSILLVGVVAALALRSVALGVLAVLPALSAALAVLGTMGWSGIRLDLSSCVITSVVVGIGVDFATHLLFRRDTLHAPADSDAELNERAIVLAGPPIVYDALSNIVAFGVWTGSGLLPLQHFGWLICVSMAACALATLTLLPALLSMKPVAAIVRRPLPIRGPERELVPS